MAPEGLREEVTTAQLARKDKIRAPMIIGWKRTAIGNVGAACGYASAAAGLKKLHARIDALAIERDILSAACSLNTR